MNLPQRRQRLREVTMQLNVLRAKVEELQAEEAEEMFNLPGSLGLLEQGMQRNVGDMQDALNLLDQAGEILDQVVERYL